ncbi:MAG: DUF998 domain-containing protein [Spirochaetota bacterium]
MGKTPQLGRSTGFLGLLTSATLLVGVAVPAIAYRGKAGEAYSFLNHFVSELGEVGVSPLAVVFNLTLVLGGLALVPFLVSLALAMRVNLWAKLGSIAGVAAAAFLALVGVFPMNDYTAHIFVAMNFFRLGLVMILLYTVAVFTQRPAARILPNWVNWAGALSFACFFVFLFVVPGIAKMPAGLLAPSAFPARPSPLPLAISEWSIYFFTMIWIATVSARLAFAGAPRPRSELRLRAELDDPVGR